MRGCGGKSTARTSVVAELDVRLGAVGVEVGGGGPRVDGLGVELGGQLEVVVDEGLLGLALQIRRGHGGPPGVCGRRPDDDLGESEQNNRGHSKVGRQGRRRDGWG